MVLPNSEFSIPNSADRVKSTSAADLEGAIEGIVKNELQAIVNLGGILGFVVGLMQTVFLFISQTTS